MPVKVLWGAKKKAQYAVGYGKPPVHTQFKPGQSGNPAGRQKGVKNFKTELKEEMAEKIVLLENGKKKVISRQRAAIKSMVSKSIKGSERASALLFGYLARYLDENDSAPGSDHLSAEDRAILEDLERRLYRKLKAKDASDD